MAKSMDKIIGADLVNKPDGRKFHGPDKYKKMAEWTFDNNPQIAAKIHANIAAKSSVPVSYSDAKAAFAKHFETRVNNVNAWAKKLGTKPDSIGEILKQSIRGQGYSGEVAKRNWMSGFEAGLGKSKHIAVGGKLAGRTTTDPTYAAFRGATGWKGSSDDYSRLVWNAAGKYFEYTDKKGTVWIFEITGNSPKTPSYKKK